MNNLCECGCGQTTKAANSNDRHNGYIKGQPRRFRSGHHNLLHVRGTITKVAADVEGAITARRIAEREFYNSFPRKSKPLKPPVV